jgi:hypothetical protein
MKGGVGKTTIVALLGRHAAYKGRRVLVVDLDPQANLSQAYMRNAYVQFLESEEPSIVEVFDGYRPPTWERESPTRLNPGETVREVFYTNGTLLRPEYFATVGFPLLAKSLDLFRTENPSHHTEVIGVAINNGFYDGGNDGGPEKRRAMREIHEEASKNGWHVSEELTPRPGQEAVSGHSGGHFG